MKAVRVVKGIALVIGIVLGLAACSAGEERITPKPPPPVGKAITLKPFASCSELEGVLKDIVKKRIESILYYSHDGGDTDSPVVTSAPGDASSGEETVNFTDTNIQEAGVDESDIIKTNGEYVFALSEKKLHIAKTWPLEKFDEIASLEIEGEPISMYLSTDKLIIFSNLYSNEVFDQTEENDETSYKSWSYNEVTKVTIVDVSRTSSPVVTKESYYEGRLISDRRIENIVYLVLTSPIITDFLNVTDYNNVEASVSENIKMTDNSSLKDFLPRVLHKTPSTKNADPIVSCGNFNYSEDSKGESFTKVLTIDITEPGNKDVATVILGSPSIVYASKNSIFLAEAVQTTWWMATGEEIADETAIHHFAINTSDKIPAYTGGRIVQGHLISQFAMSEFDGYLRVATTVGHVNKEGQPVYNNIYTLNSGSPEMPITGAIEDLASGEQIYAVRFIGSRGFVVTFKKIDPLFVIDLSDPASPTLAGELKVPGFSTYLHPFDDGTLIGLGKGADDMGDFAWFQGLQLSLFNVEDMSNPTALEQIEIGSRMTDSDALWDHHAFTFDSTKNLLAIPVTLYEGGSGGSSYGTFQYSGLHIYNVSKSDGFTLAGVIKLSAEDSDYGRIRRSIIIGDENEQGVITLRSNEMGLYLINGNMDKIKSIEFSEVED